MIVLYALSILQMLSYLFRISRKAPMVHTVGLILSYFLAIPFVLRNSPTWSSPEIQLLVTLIITALDWFSFHQDITRFSESEKCMFGNCRYNSQYTGIIAHVGDAISVVFASLPLMGLLSFKHKMFFYVGMIIYVMMGMYVIRNMTKDGSGSDLRYFDKMKGKYVDSKSDAEKCGQVKIMKASWRGGLNDLITVLGILVAWQSFFDCGKARCNAKFFPFNQFKNLVDASGNQFIKISRTVFMFLLAIVPTIANFVNTSAQHGIKAGDYDLPLCLDG